jgi:hypothetical protein
MTARPAERMVGSGSRRGWRSTWGDTDIFDWGGLLSALIGTFIVLGLAGYFLRRRQPGPPVQ